MARFSPLGQSNRRPFGSTQLRVEALEDRAVPAATLVSTDFNLSSQANSDSAVVGTSEDGRYVIVQSTASNFIKDQIDSKGDMDLFWIDRVTGDRRLVSAEDGSKGLKAVGVVPSVPGQLANAVISADGRSVAFVSNANAQRLTGSTFIQDAGDATADVFVWKADVAEQLDDTFFGSFVTPTALVSRTRLGDAVGLTNSATNPSISNDGSVVAFVSRLDAATVDSPIISDNGDVTPDVFKATVNSTRFNVNVSFVDTVTQFRDPLNLNLPAAFGDYTGFVDVDALGRYMSGDGTTFAVVSSLNPSKISTTFPSAPPGTIDAYHITTDFFGSTVVLATSKPGIPGTTVGGQVTAAIIPKDAPNTIVFSAALPSGSTLVPGYVNQNGGRAELYWRQILGTEPQPAVLVSAAAGSTVLGANAGLDLSIGNFSVEGEGTKVYFTSPATNLVTGVTDTNNANDVFVRTIATGVTSVISVTGGAGVMTGNAASSRPRPTNDGWLVGFESKATNIGTLIDTNLGSDIFVRNLSNNTTGIASASPDGISTGDAPSSGPVIGGTKTNAVIFFNSNSTNLDLTYTFPGGQQNVFSVNAPIPASDASRIVAVSGGVNGFVGLARFDASGKLLSGPPIAPFPGFTGEVRVASADVNGDGVPDVIAGAGPGGGPRVRVIDGVTFQTIADIFAFESTFTGGVYVAAGDFNKDGFAEIVIGAGEGGGPRVLIFDGKTRAQISDIFVFENSFRGGIRVSVGDFNGDGNLDLVTAAGEGGGPRVKVVDGALLPRVVPLADFFAYEQTLRNGAYVGSGDINGDGKADIVTGAGPGGSPRVSVFDANTFLTTPAVNPDTARVIDYFAYDDATRDGVRVAIKNADGDGNGDIVTGPGSGPPLIRVFSTARFSEAKVPQQLSEQFAFDQPIGRLGAYVG